MMEFGWLTYVPVELVHDLRAVTEISSLDLLQGEGEDT